jgi:hypothetical protein
MSDGRIDPAVAAVAASRDYSGPWAPAAAWVRGNWRRYQDKTVGEFAAAMAAEGRRNGKPVAEVKFTNSGPQLYVHGVMVREALGFGQDETFRRLARVVNAAAEAPRASAPRPPVLREVKPTPDRVERVARKKKPSRIWATIGVSTWLATAVTLAVITAALAARMLR